MSSRFYDKVATVLAWGVPFVVLLLLGSVLIELIR